MYARPMSVTRRTALKGMGALAGSAAFSNLVPGCSSSPPSTMVFMMMENRTYDHFLGSRSLVEGLAGEGLPKGATNPDMNGNPVGLSVPPVTPAGCACSIRRTSGIRRACSSTMVRTTAS